MRQFLKYLLLIAVFSGKGIGYAQVSDTVEYESRYRVDRLAINSSASEFAPFFANKKLYFISDRELSAAVVYKERSSGSTLTDIYSAENRNNARFSSPKIESTLSEKVNEGSVCFGPGGKERFITRSVSGPAGNFLKIFVQADSNGKWSDPKMPGFCSVAGNFCHPSLSADGNTMIFASDLNRRATKMDLYITSRSNGEWSPPQPLQAANSSDDELFPFICGDSLFFTSNRKGGPGGMDLYAMNWKKEGACIPLPYPINSDADDFGIWTDSTFTSGYFSSNRNPLTKDDIYAFSLVIPDFARSKAPPRKTKFCYTFFDESNLHEQDTSHLQYEWDFGNGEKVREKVCRHCYPAPGKYEVRLNVVERVSGEVFYNQSTYEHIVEEPLSLRINCSDTALARHATSIDHAGSALHGYKIGKAYWSFGDGKYGCGLKVKHRYQGNGTYKLELLVEAVNESSGQSETFRTEKKIVVKNQ